jgi:2-polyprenyl-3-methyl-5-hydroxy-6-metoxy-1,4-benzoquinol methylase
MSAAQAYAELVDARTEQQLRLRGPSVGDRWAGAARRLRADPRRELDANLKVLASYIEPDEVLVDIGGGAGRLGLPLALRCREVLNVDSSASMIEEFNRIAAESGIGNARAVYADWAKADVRGDVSIAANVTYFVRDIVPFIEKMEAVASRRVVISVWSTPPPNINAALLSLVYGEEELPAPSHQQLLPVLWEMGIHPDVTVLPARWDERLPWPAAASREEVIATAAERLSLPHRALLRRALRQHTGRALPALAAIYSRVAHHLAIRRTRLRR